MTPRETAPRLTTSVSERDHVLGPAKAPVTLVEYGDYECAFCGEAHPIVKSVQQLLAGHLRFAFRHFPLSTVHPHAQHAAEAAEAAGVQGKFWQMHDVLFESQDALEDDDLLQYAAALRLNVRQFMTELASHVHAPRVREEFLSGARSGVNGTPTFFINAVRHDGGYDLRALLDAIACAANLSHGES